MPTNQISDLIDGKSFIRIEHVGCPICGTKYPSRPIKTQFGMTAHVAVCGPCRIAFQTPRPSLEATLAYMNWRWSARDVYVDDTGAQLSRGHTQLGFVQQCAPGPARLLDFGAGSGSFVRVARDAGWFAEGVERSETARAKALDRFGVSLHERVPDTQYDVITMWDVIEHLRSPAEMLHTLFKSLKPGGFIFIETGNWENWQRLVNGDRWHVYLLDHHFYFSPSSLRHIVVAAGYDEFRLLDVNRKGPGGLQQFRKMPRYTIQSWIGCISARCRWADHYNITTMIAVARRSSPAPT